MEGGYQILNLGRINLTSTAKKVPGAYDYIEKNLQHKVVLLEGLKLDGKLYDSIFTTFAKSYGNYIGTFTIDAKLYSVVISSDDLVHTKRLIPVGDDTIELVESMIADSWESDEVYSKGDRVTRKHSLYELTADNSTGDPPESNPGKWKKVTVGSGGGGGTTYSLTETQTPDTWVDGRPIYCRVFEWSTPKRMNSSNWTDLGILAGDISLVVSAEIVDIDNLHGPIQTSISLSGSPKTIRVYNYRPAEVTFTHLTVKYVKEA